MRKRIQQPPGTLDSEAAAKALGLSYDKLMRLVRAGYVRPAGYTGSPRTPGFWSKEDLVRAETANRLTRLDLTGEQINYLLNNFDALFQEGFRPSNIMHRLAPDGKTWARDLALTHPARDRVIHKEKIGEATVEVVEQIQLPLEVFNPVRWDWSKPAHQQIHGVKPPKRPAKGGKK